MKRTAIVVAGFVTIVFTMATGVYWFGAPVIAQTPTTDVILPGCNIPKSYGRLVSLLPGANGGAAGAAAYAVFEAESGEIRWVAMAAAGLVANEQRPPSGMTAPAFYQRFECALNGEWKRH